MICPECKTKITAKHYDAEYEWYECPKCEGAFTIDEIQEASDESNKPKGRGKQGDRSRSQGAKAGRSRGTQRKDARGAHKGVQAANGATKSGIVAKGKKRRTQIAEDEEVIKQHEEDILVPKVKQIEPKHHRDEIETRQVVNIWADEMEDIYHDLGIPIDTMNAQDKALILWREMRIGHAVTAREQEVSHALCKEHA